MPDLTYNSSLIEVHLMSLSSINPEPVDPHVTLNTPEIGKFS